LDFGFYEFVSNNTDQQVPAYESSVSRRFAMGGDLSLSIDQHFLLETGFLSTMAGRGYPDAKLLSFRAHYLIPAGVLTPYAGAGMGYLWQAILHQFDGGTPASANGGAAVFEAGVMLRNDTGPGRLALCAQFVLPFFSIEPQSFSGVPFSPVTVSFFLFGAKFGL
jgi:hypothetical protein